MLRIKSQKCVVCRGSVGRYQDADAFSGMTPPFSEVYESDCGVDGSTLAILKYNHAFNALRIV